MSDRRLSHSRSERCCRGRRVEVSDVGGREVEARSGAAEEVGDGDAPSFECFSGRGAAAQVVLGGKAYQVNVMVGDRASKQRVAEALTVTRSFNLAG